MQVQIYSKSPPTNSGTRSAYRTRISNPRLWLPSTEATSPTLNLTKTTYRAFNSYTERSHREGSQRRATRVVEPQNHPIRSAMTSNYVKTALLILFLRVLPGAVPKPSTSLRGINTGGWKMMVSCRGIRNSFPNRGRACLRVSTRLLLIWTTRLISLRFGWIFLVFLRDCNRIFFWFQGRQYWRYVLNKMDGSYPKLISDGFQGVPDNIDAAMVWSGNGKIYFFKGEQKYKSVLHVIFFKEFPGETQFFESLLWVFLFISYFLVFFSLLFYFVLFNFFLALDFYFFSVFCNFFLHFFLYNFLLYFFK